MVFFKDNYKFKYLWFLVANCSGWKIDLTKGYGITLFIKQLIIIVFSWFLKHRI